MLGSADAAAMEIGGTLPPELAIPPQRLVQFLSFSHFAIYLSSKVLSASACFAKSEGRFS